MLSESALGSHSDPAYETDKIGPVSQNYRINSNNFFKHTLHSLNPFLSYMQSECGIEMGEKATADGFTNLQKKQIQFLQSRA